MLRVFSSLSLICFLAPSAHADSDGYFCVGTNYIAYQFGLAAPPVAPHNVFIARLDAGERLITATVVQLPQFQVHGMRCLDDVIIIASFDSLYSVSLDRQRRPSHVVVTPLRSRGVMPVEFGPQENLGSFSRAISSLQVERRLLSQDSSGVAFVLEMVPKGAARICEVAIVTRLVKIGRDGKELTSLLIFAGNGYRECGGNSSMNRDLTRS